MIIFILIKWPMNRSCRALDSFFFNSFLACKYWCYQNTYYYILICNYWYYLNIYHKYIYIISIIDNIYHSYLYIYYYLDITASLQAIYWEYFIIQSNNHPLQQFCQINSLHFLSKLKKSIVIFVLSLFICFEWI